MVKTITPQKGRGKMGITERQAHWLNETLADAKEQLPKTCGADPRAIWIDARRILFGTYAVYVGETPVWLCALTKDGYSIYNRSIGAEKAQASRQT